MSVCKGERPKRTEHPGIPDPLWGLLVRAWGADPKTRPIMRQIVNKLVTTPMFWYPSSLQHCIHVVIVMLSRILYRCSVAKFLSLVHTSCFPSIPKRIPLLSYLHQCLNLLICLKLQSVEWCCTYMQRKYYYLLRGLVRTRTDCIHCCAASLSTVVSCSWQSSWMAHTC